MKKIITNKLIDLIFKGTNETKKLNCFNTTNWVYFKTKKINSFNKFKKYYKADLDIVKKVVNSKNRLDNIYLFDLNNNTFFNIINDWFKKNKNVDLTI